MSIYLIYSLPVEELSCCHCDRPMGRVDQVIDIFTIFIREGILTATATQRPKYRSKADSDGAGMSNWDLQELALSLFHHYKFST